MKWYIILFYLMVADKTYNIKSGNVTLYWYSVVSSASKTYKYILAAAIDELRDCVKQNKKKRKKLLGGGGGSRQC